MLKPVVWHLSCNVLKKVPSLASNGSNPSTTSPFDKKTESLIWLSGLDASVGAFLFIPTKNAGTAFAGRRFWKGRGSKGFGAVKEVFWGQALG